MDNKYYMNHLAKHPDLENGKKTIYVDIDETICVTPSNRNYAEAVPIPENIEKANQLYDAGHTIVYWTARGTTTKINWFPVTQEQFKKWGVKYHEIRMGKPAYDVLICDKTFNANLQEWNNEVISHIH